MSADLKTSEIKGDVGAVNDLESWSTQSHPARSAPPSICTATMQTFLLPQRPHQRLRASCKSSLAYSPLSSLISKLNGVALVFSQGLKWNPLVICFVFNTKQ